MDFKLVFFTFLFSRKVSMHKHTSSIHTQSHACTAVVVLTNFCSFFFLSTEVTTARASPPTGPTLASRHPPTYVERKKQQTTRKTKHATQNQTNKKKTPMKKHKYPKAAYIAVVMLVCMYIYVCMYVGRHCYCGGWNSYRR